ncbi:MAG: hypothetical protein D6682_07005 [Zetaproteobacteria bacterium]|nr:MAG: hypothetical protein D6682_07005 [Zetaproteobacteria bacterium]
MNVVWVASYPRSGNSWMRRFISYYLTGIFGDEMVRQVCPDLHELLPMGRGLNENYDGSILCKSHFVLSPQHPYFSRTAGIIYFCRYPKDVLLSCLQYHKDEKTMEIESDAAYARAFIQNMGDPRWKAMGMGNWVENVASWLARSADHAHCLFRYESLIRDTERELVRLARFLTPDEEIRMDRIRVFIESQSGHTPKSMQSLDRIEQGLDELFDERFHDVLSLLGYA